MAWLEINPRFRELCRQHSLTTPDDFLGLPALIISGHPNRHVTRVTIGAGPSGVTAYLKREHRVFWIERLRNACAGFGFVSRSRREARVLGALQEAGVHGPQLMAVGEDHLGQGFLLIREMSGVVELRSYLQERRSLPERRRTQFVQKLGKALAQIHNAGFDHQDLYSKHVFVQPSDQKIWFVDWQRSRQRRIVGWRQRWRDLAALAATVDEHLLSQRERILCLRAYLRQCRVNRLDRQSLLLRSAYRIAALEQRFLQRRRVRELRELPAASAGHQVIWHGGEALCMTPEFHTVVRGQKLDWLSLDHLHARPSRQEVHTAVELPDGRKAALVRRRESRLFSWLWSLGGRRRLTSTEVRQAGALFRLERYHIAGPRVLAFGQKFVAPWKVESFLLTESTARATPLHRFLSFGRSTQGNTEQSLTVVDRRRLLRQAGILLRRVHDAGCFLNRGDGQDDCPLAVECDESGSARIVLTAIPARFSNRGASSRLALHDLHVVHDCLSHCWSNRAEELRFLLSYLGVRRLTSPMKRLTRSFLGASRPLRLSSAPSVSRPRFVFRLLQLAGRSLP